MEDQNVAPQQEAVQADTAPAQPAQQEQQAQVSQEPVQNTQVEQETQTQTQSVPQGTAETQTEPSQTNSLYEQPDISQFMPSQSTAPIQADEDGYIDPNKFYQQVMNDVQSKLAFQKSEERAWAQIEKKYPEITSDSDLRDLVHATRLNDVTRGGKGDLDNAAGKVFGKLQNYQSKGKAQAQVSESVQKSATLQTQTANTNQPTKDSDLIERMSRGDSTASETLISRWLEEGKL
jgi:hypothetical protein